MITLLLPREKANKTALPSGRSGWTDIFPSFTGCRILAILRQFQPMSYLIYTPLNFGHVYYVTVPPSKTGWDDIFKPKLAILRQIESHYRLADVSNINLGIC